MTSMGVFPGREVRSESFEVAFSNLRSHPLGRNGGQSGWGAAALCDQRLGVPDEEDSSWAGPQHGGGHLLGGWNPLQESMA